ncbi:DUF4276 family protein [Myxococcota bacterium]|nr:DUF4276 family protein [Myxococcota bacterium]MBU1534361.1 DUF4276 family protein [Myxococcota bacterium]
MVSSTCDSKADCHIIKDSLSEKCRSSLKQNYLVRIACFELETFYLGDLAAVEKGMEIKGLSKKQKNAKCRNPDDPANASEEMKRLTEFKYQNISGSRDIGPHMSLSDNRSLRFQALTTGTKKLIEDWE